MPPAVDPGDPPISIKTISSMLPVPDREDKEAVLKPAVLGVIVRNRERKTRSLTDPEVYSNKNKRSIGMMIRTPVVARTTLLCIR